MIEWLLAPTGPATLADVALVVLLLLSQVVGLTLALYRIATRRVKR